MWALKTQLPKITIYNKNIITKSLAKSQFTICERSSDVGEMFSEVRKAPSREEVLESAVRAAVLEHAVAELRQTVTDSRVAKAELQEKLTQLEVSRPRRGLHEHFLFAFSQPEHSNFPRKSATAYDNARKNIKMIGENCGKLVLNVKAVCFSQKDQSLVCF